MEECVVTQVKMRSHSVDYLVYVSDAPQHIDLFRFCQQQLSGTVLVPIKLQYFFSCSFSKWSILPQLWDFLDFKDKKTMIHGGGNLQSVTSGSWPVNKSLPPFLLLPLLLGQLVNVH